MVTNLSLCGQPFLGVAEAGILKPNFRVKRCQNPTFLIGHLLDFVEITKLQKPRWLYQHLQ